MIIPYELRCDRWEDLTDEAVRFIEEQSILEPKWEGLDGGDHGLLYWWKRGRARVETVLDAGCGLGTYYPILSEMGEYTGVDSSPAMIKRVREKYPDGRFELANLLELPFEDDSFDLVHTMSVMPHIRNFEDALKELRRVCKKYMHFNIYVGDVDYITHGVWCDTLQIVSRDRLIPVLEGLGGFRTVKLWDVTLDDEEGEHLFVTLRK